MAKHLLIIDDHMDILLLLKDRLEDLGYEITTASNGEEGLECIERQSIDGILLDLEMPAMDGLTLISTLR